MRGVLLVDRIIQAEGKPNRLQHEKGRAIKILCVL